MAAHPTGGELLARAQELAGDLGGLLRRSPGRSLPVPGRTVDTPTGRYELRGTLVQASHLSSAPLVLVSVSPPAAAGPTSAALRGRFGLTLREAEVTLLLARGDRDRAIAKALGISHHTVRRHVEQALAKLGVNTRAAVAGRIRG